VLLILYESTEIGYPSGLGKTGPAWNASREAGDVAHVFLIPYQDRCAAWTALRHGLWWRPIAIEQHTKADQMPL
jgi:hypothetical protein